MAAQAQTKDENDSMANPLDRLSTLLGDDMQKVNALILQRMDSNVPLIPRIASYLIAAGGKRLRPLLTLAAARLYGCEDDRPFGLASAVEFIHTATLLHDDVVDVSAERRGQKSANVVFGNQSSVLVGDFLFSRAFQLMVEDGSLEVLRVLSEASATIAEGEILQLQTANNINTTMAQYEQVIGAKTAALFAAACEIGPVVAGQDGEAQTTMRDFGYYLGMAFQVIDDLLDYSASQQKLGKTIGDDFREGKMTAPVIFALQKADETEHAFWQRTIADKDQGEKDFDMALSLIHKHKALHASYEMAVTCHGKAYEALQKAPGHPLKGVLADILDFTVNRDF